MANNVEQLWYLRDSKSPIRVATSSPESDEMKSPSRESPDSRCVICLGKLQNKSFTDSCLHQFCFQCLLQWSKVKAECPLCKQPFKSIIHNVRSNLDYDQYHVEREEPHYVLPDFMHSYNFDLIPVDRRFRYRSTMTREYFRELAESFLAHTRRLPEDVYQITPLVPVDPPTGNIRRSNRLHVPQMHHRMRQRGTTDYRRNIYLQDLWVQDLADISGRYRECTPQFYRDNPAQIHRIIPWLNREVNVLMSDRESHAAYVLNRIVSLLTQHSIRSREFRDVVHPYFGDRTDHFIHELYTFARSVYDISGFDQHAIYGTNPNYATEVQDISSTSDSDIEVLETVKIEGKKSKKSSRHGFKKILLKRADGDSRNGEPIAGPSGVTSSNEGASIDICDSDPDEIKIIEDVKPEPEVVTISSGDESVVDMKSHKLGKSRRHCSDDEQERKESKHKTGKGKCESNGLGLKGKQKRKYIKSRRSRNSRSSSSSSSSSSTSSNRSSSSSSLSAVTLLRSSSASNSDSDGHKPTKSSKKKKSKVSKKKNKGKTKRKESRKPKLSSKLEKKITKRKKVKSCVVVPSSTSNFSQDTDPEPLASYWSIVRNPAAYRCRMSTGGGSSWDFGQTSKKRKRPSWSSDYESGRGKPANEEQSNYLKSCVEKVKINSLENINSETKTTSNVAPSSSSPSTSSIRSVSFKPSVHSDHSS